MLKPGKKPGTPKSGGRKKGTPNKVTKDIRSRIAEFIEGNFETYCDKMSELDGRDYVRAYNDMCQYVLPKLQSVAVDAVVEKAKTIEDKLQELSE